MEIVDANAQQAAALTANAQQLEQVARETAQLVASRYAWWKVVREFAGQYDVNLSDVVGPELADQNAKCDGLARDFATWFAALNHGTAELVARQDASELRLAVVVRGLFARPMGVFPLVPIIIVGAVAGAGWLVWDAWRELELQRTAAQQAHEANQAKWAELAAKAQAMGPDAMKQLQRVIDAANAQAQSPFGQILAPLARSVDTLTDAAGSAVSKAADWVPIAVGLGLWWWWSKRGKRA